MYTHYWEIARPLTTYLQDLELTFDCKSSLLLFVMNYFAKKHFTFPSQCSCLYHSFIGCIRHLVINQEAVDFQTASESLFGNDPTPAIPGCPRDTACGEGLCQNGGMCINGGWDTYSCECTETFTSTDCSIGKKIRYFSTSPQSHLNLGYLEILLYPKINKM